MNWEDGLAMAARLTLRFAAAFLVAVALLQTPSAGAGENPRDHDLEFLETATFGATNGSYAELKKLGRDAWIERQLAMPRQPLPQPMEAAIDASKVATTPPLALVTEIAVRQKAAQEMPAGDEKTAAQQSIQKDMSEVTREAQIRSLMRAIYAPDQLRERMTWFWFNHFNVHLGKSNIRLLVGDYEDRAIRANALGRFRDLLGATLRHPAMLRYLDNAENAAGRPNENYARELLELHTMGVGSGYTQKDVEELARILTGFGIEQGAGPPKLRPDLAAQYVRDGLFAFNPARHDYGDKVFLGHTIHGRGAAEVDEVLDILAAHPATAKHIATRLATYFASDTPPPALVEAMSREFLRSGGSIPAVLRILFRSPDFDRSLGDRPKDAVRFVASAVRLAYEEKPILNGQPVIGWLNRLGEALFNRPTPDGYPLAAGAWTGPGQMTARFEVARAIGSGPSGLFRVDEKTDRPGFPVIRGALFYAAWDKRLSPATRSALDQAVSPQDWNTLFLSSPEFMQGGARP